MRVPLGVIVAASILVATGANAGPEAHRAGLKMCAAFAQHYTAAYSEAAAQPEGDRQAAFETLKTRQSSERMQNASRGANELESFYTSVEHFVQRTALLLAIQEPDLSPAAAQGRMFDQCSENVRPLLDLPGN